MPEPANLQRPATDHVTICDLAHCLMERASSEPGWAVDDTSFCRESGKLADAEHGVALRYRAPEGDSEVRLHVSERRAKLVARTYGGAGAWMELKARILLTLGATPTLGGQRVESADALASALMTLGRRPADDSVLPTRPGEEEVDDTALAVIVDPNDDFRSILTALVEHDGFAAEATPDPDEALSWALSRAPVVVIGEHPLPLQDGRLLCEAMLGDPRAASIPFLAVTSRALPGDLESARQAHPHGVLAKPVKPRVILEHIRALVEP